MATNNEWSRQRFVPHPKEKCQDPRQRWPEIDAILQVGCRALLILLHLASLLIIFTTHQVLSIWPYETFTSVGYGLILCIVEISSLAAPGTIPPFRRFPRLPSKWLALAELIEICLVIWSMHALLLPIWRLKDDEGLLIDDPACPIETCVSKEERFGIAVYTCQLVTLMFHIGFFVMAITHVLIRNFSNWSDTLFGKAK